MNAVPDGTTVRRNKLPTLEQECMNFVKTTGGDQNLRKTLAAKARSGALERVARGLYWDPVDAEITENHDLVRVCAAIPNAVICLLSALQFHHLTTEWPREVWLAIDRQSKIPKSLHLPLRVHHFSKLTLNFGVEEHLLEGIQVRVTSPEKTVADCFRFRNRYGVDVAVEALRDLLKRRRPIEPLLEAARVCRVEKLVRMYLEAFL
jgi:predicted transcriptional regulator of viral defense system